MSADNGKVHKLEAVRPKADTDEVKDIQPEPLPNQGLADTQKDMSKVAMIVSFLAVILLVIFFFGMNRNIAGLTDEVKSLGVLREDVSNLDQRMVKMQEEMPSQVKRMIAHDLVNEMAMKAAYLGNTLEGEVDRTKMQTVLQTLKEVRASLEQ